MEFQKVTASQEIHDELLLFVFRIYQSTSGKYPRLEWSSEKPSTHDFSSFSRVYGPFLKFRLEREFDELYVMREKEIIATFALVYKFEGKEVPWIPIDLRDHVYLEFFMVRDNFRGKGIGKMALELSLKRARERGKRLAVVTFEDLDSYNYYLVHGFKLIRRYKNFVILEK